MAKEAICAVLIQRTSEKELENLMSDPSVLRTMMDKWYIKMEAKLLEKMKAAVSEEMEDQRRQMLDMEVQKTIVARDLTKRREERGGYDSLKALTHDPTMRMKLKRYKTLAC